MRHHPPPRSLGKIILMFWTAGVLDNYLGVDVFGMHNLADALR
ncbi:hypothetical protein MSP7336_01280 [Mycobacterium shimoidei]|uniref:Uncharacterized protein n=1 Tax=Mycobacterium shimoidei TaxID=29313 RepID=A0A375YVZ9_MYCSH|nr:hypothetical protein MSP7336_01280 [Mycobacterium shimoidei]